MNQEKILEEILRRLDNLEKAIFGRVDSFRMIGDKGKISTGTTAQKIQSRNLDFSIPLRPFIKKYARGLSGPKKFTLLLARLSSGDLKGEVVLAEIERIWNSMNSLFKVKFNRFYSQEAKDNDWVESRKKGMYNLRPSWEDIFGK